MFRLRSPSPADLDAFLAQQAKLGPSYAPVGATHPDRAEMPAGYQVDYHRLYLGHGEAMFERARAALQNWAMYDQPWLSLYPYPPAISEGKLACVIARHLGFVSVSAFRIVYVLEETNRFGFAIGTPPGHIERGEERFLLELLDDASVWFSILAFSKPQHPLVRLGYPLARYYQKRFAEGALSNMKVVSKG